MCMVAYELKRGNPVGLILAKTLNGLDALHRKEVSFIVIFFFTHAFFFYYYYYFLHPPLSPSLFSDMATREVSVASTSHCTSQHLPP